VDKAMTITFRPENAEVIEVTSPHFNPEEAEDHIYNPRYETEYICPVLNVAVTNAFRLMRKLGIREDHVGEYDDVEVKAQPTEENMASALEAMSNCPTEAIEKVEENKTTTN
jgi:ferredoxin